MHCLTMRKLLSLSLLIVTVSIASIAQFHGHCHVHCDKAESCALHLSSFENPRIVDKHLSFLDFYALPEAEVEIVAPVFYTRVFAVEGNCPIVSRTPLHSGTRAPPSIC